MTKEASIPTERRSQILHFLVRQPFALPARLLHDLVTALLPSACSDPLLRRCVLLLGLRSDLATLRSADAQPDISCDVFDRLRSFATEKLREYRRHADGPVDERPLEEVDTEEAVLRSVEAFVEEELKQMGPSYFEIKAEKLLSRKDSGGISIPGPFRREVGNAPEDHEASDVGNCGGDTRSTGKGGREELDEFNHAETSCSELGDSRSVLDRERSRRALEGGSGAAAAGGGVPCHDKETSNSEGERHLFSFGSGHTSHRDNRSLTPETIKAKEALEVNCRILHAVVEDPLPGAVNKAADVLVNLSIRAVELKESADPKANVGEGICVTTPGLADDSMDETNNVQPTVNEGTRSRPSLMERNPTAHTFEWEDDSIDSTDSTTDSGKKIRLPSSRKRKVSPLKIAEVPKFSMRRKKHKWSLLEEETLRKSVEKYGKGNWKFILNCNRSIFLERTEVDLKDKWRNMSKHQR